MHSCSQMTSVKCVSKHNLGHTIGQTFPDRVARLALIHNQPFSAKSHCSAVVAVWLLWGTNLALHLIYHQTHGNIDRVL